MADTCPHPSHKKPDMRQQMGRSVAATALLSDTPVFQPERPLLPGVGTGVSGLAGTPAEFSSLVGKVHENYGISEREIARDYWLTSCLHGIATSDSDGLALKGDTGETLATFAFAGGTALVSAWDITERYSEDLDLLALTASEAPSSSVVKKVLSLPDKWVSAAIGVPKEEFDVRHMGNVGFRRTHIEIGGEYAFLKMETTVEPYDEDITETRTVMSLMGRFASARQLEEFPELGGFALPCVVPGYTAVNKFDALHRRATGKDLPNLTRRGRDLYDLARIAASEHADAARRLIPAKAERASDSPGSRPDVPRPRNGYASSIAFSPGTGAYEALRRGYEQSTKLVWSKPPTFEAAVELACSLDD